jgi:hypothetical protein
MAFQDSSFDVFDYSRQGTIDSQGNVVQLKGKDAILEALKNWISSSPRDFFREKKGGIIQPLLLKPINSNSDELIESAIRDGIQRDFDLNLVIQQLIVTSIPEERIRRIKLTVFSTEFNQLVSIDEEIQVL